MAPEQRAVIVSTLQVSKRRSTLAWMARLDVEAFARDGFVLLDVLNADELGELRAQLELLICIGNALERPAQFFASDFQHLGDRLEDYAKLTKHYYFHLLTDPRTLPMQHVFHHPELLAGVEQILGPQLILDNASLFAAEPGTTYKLGWHRDVIQIPQHLIHAQAIYNPQRFHNNVQCNLPCYEDSALWVVPGSHVRPNTAGEDAAFRGSKHYAPPGAQMPGGVQVHISPGQALLYNNNLIHRGYCEAFPERRLALHIGYHSRTRPPTWHFYLLNEAMFSSDYRQRMSPRMRQMIEDYFECRREYPHMEDTWPSMPESP
jgi:hypothetical protein